MDARRKLDRISTLSDMILVMIISNLPFKQATRTCTLNKRWKNLHRKNTNVAFNESEFVNFSDDEEIKRAARVSFVRFMLDWISRFCGEGVKRFEVCFSKPVGFETEINSLLEFAVEKEVKSLVLDFSDPSWITSNQVATVFQLPECVYNHTKLESLKLFACVFDPLKLSGSLKSLCFCWMELGNNIMTLLSNSPLVESLSLLNCWNIGLEEITRYNSRLRELVIENCVFSTPVTNLDLPNLEIFRYIGRVYCFRFIGVNRTGIKEAYLDYGLETEDDRSNATLLSDLLNDLSSAKKLTICPYLIQLIQHQEDPNNLQTPMETKHLVIKTSIRANELYGIRLIMNSCPVLETLTLVMVPHRTVAETVMNFDPYKFWDYENVYPCFEEMLKVVNWRNFSGVPNETGLLKHLIRNGQELERVEFFLPRGHSVDMYNWVTYLVDKIGDNGEAASSRLWMFTNTTD